MKKKKIATYFEPQSNIADYTTVITYIITKYDYVESPDFRPASLNKLFIAQVYLTLLNFIFFLCCINEIY